MPVGQPHSLFPQPAFTLPSQGPVPIPAVTVENPGADAFLSRIPSYDLPAFEKNVVALRNLEGPRYEIVTASPICFGFYRIITSSIFPSSYHPSQLAELVARSRIGHRKFNQARDQPFAVFLPVNGGIACRQLLPVGRGNCASALLFKNI